MMIYIRKRYASFIACNSYNKKNTFFINFIQKVFLYLTLNFPVKTKYKIFLQDKKIVDV